MNTILTAHDITISCNHPEGADLDAVKEAVAEALYQAMNGTRFDLQKHTPKDLPDSTTAEVREGPTVVEITLEPVEVQRADRRDTDE